MKVRVEAVPGHLGEPAPRRLLLGEQSVELVEVLDRWPGADHTYFKMRAETGAAFILRHDRLRDEWGLVMYQARG